MPAFPDLPKGREVSGVVLLLIDCDKDLSANSWGRKYEGEASKQREKADIAESEAARRKGTDWSKAAMEN